MRSPRSFFVLPLRFICWVLLCGAALAQPFVPPPEPNVRPSIGKAYVSDANRDAIDDRLAARAQFMRFQGFHAPTVIESATAQAILELPVEIELVFNEQVTQNQIDAFLAQGGEITYQYMAVSYGWNGRIALEKVATLPGLMGATLLLVQEAIPMQLHMDTATKTGRVRPVWASGFAGNVAGFDGDPSITIAIVDTGVNESHTDLNGRRVFWQDFSTDALASPADLIQHGSHVAGIALGTGAAAGVGAGTLFFTDNGSLSGVPNGSFFPSPFELPAASVTVTFVASWVGGGTTTLHLLSHPKGVSGSYATHGSITGSSPLTVSIPLTGDIARAYTAGLLSNGAMTDFVVKGQVTNYPAVGDGFNRMRGVAPGCNWAGAKVFTNAGSGTSSAISAAVDTLVANRAVNNIKVMNLSLGTVGSPGLNTTHRQKINTAVNNGIVVAVSAGNDGGTQQVDDPGRAAMALTVAASNDVNQLTNYTSQGFASPGSVAGQQEDYKPDLMAPGGSSSYHSSILSVDSNTGDGTAFADQQANDYYNIQGTSMAAPFAAGCAALVIDALQQTGVTWDFSSSQHSRYVKMILCATASESNAGRESADNNPTLQRATAGPNGFPVGKDQYEGYGMINPDAAIEAVTLAYTFGSTAIDTFGGTAPDRRVWARKVTLASGQKLVPNLTVPAGGDFDLFVYSNTPTAYGTTTLLSSSTAAGNGVAETLTYTAPSATTVLLVVKRVSGSGSFSLTAPPPPTLSAVTIASNNASPALGKQGDVVTVSFTSNVTIQTPVVTIAGRAATVSGGGTNWSGAITVNAADPAGISPFTINFMDLSGNPGTTATTTTNASSVTIEPSTQTPALTAPATNAITANPVGVNFSLPETALAGSVKLLFTGPAARTLTLAASQQTIGAHSFTFNPATPTGVAEVASITGGASVPDGNYTVTLSYQDAVGNAAATAVSTNVTIDTVTQAPALTAPATNAIAASPVSVNFSLPETALAGSVKLLFTGPAARTVTLAGSQETSGAHTFTFNPATPTGAAQIASVTGGTGVPDGSYTVTLSYQDSLGNAAATAVSTNVTIDTTPPTLTLPAPITVTATSPAGAVVNYTASASDPGGSGILSSSFLPATGTTFPIGTTMVNATATDNAGNVANGSFSVTVNPNPPPTGGSFTFTPNAGVHQGDTLSLSAPGWTDPDSPLTYQFFNGMTALNTPGAATTLDISAPAVGSYTLKVRITDSAGSFTEATQPLTVVPFSAVESWRQTFFGNYSDAGNQADGADFDLDGKSNLLEFAFHTNPTTNVAAPAWVGAGPNALQYTGTFAGGGTVTLTGQPIPRFQSIPNGVDFRALFVRRTDHVAAGLTYVVEFSGDMITWFPPANPMRTVLADNGTVQIVSVQYPFFVGGQKARFFRVEVTRAP